MDDYATYTYDASPADLTLTNRLHEVTNGLPEFRRAMLFHTFRRDVHERACVYYEEEVLSREAALQRAVRVQLPRFTNLRLRWAYRDELAQDLAQRVRNVPQRVREKLAWKRAEPEPTVDPLPPFTPENALANNPQMLADLRERFGARAVAKLFWPDTFDWPYEYLGHAQAGKTYVIAVGLEIRREGGPLAEHRLAQHGLISSRLTHDRTVLYYTVHEGSAWVTCAGRHDLYWNAHEAILCPVLWEVPEYDVDWDALMAQIQVLCEDWLSRDQGVHLIEPLEPEDLERDSTLRAALPPYAWAGFDVAPEEGAPQFRDLAITVAGWRLRAPYLGQWALTLVVFVLLCCAFAGFIWTMEQLRPFLPSALVGSEVEVTGPVGPPIEPPAEPFEITWRDVAVGVAFLTAFALIFLGLPLAGVVAMAYAIAYGLREQTIIGVPYDFREPHIRENSDA